MRRRRATVATPGEFRHGALYGVWTPLSLITPTWYGAGYCDKIYGSVREHISETTRPDFTKF